MHINYELVTIFFYKIICELYVLKNSLSDGVIIMTLGFDLQGQIQGQTCQKCTSISIFLNYSIATNKLRTNYHSNTTGG